VPIEIEGSRAAVDLRVVPDLEMAPGFLLVIFAERDAAEETETAGARGGEQDAALRHLERELEHLKTRLRETVEQSEASQEESKAANEELQAMNEELRSASEELETGREELHSINEELTTVNQELKGKVEELRRSNSDLQNLMTATQIATVFLDRSLCIQRYTPPAVALFRLIPADVGRPLSDLTSRLNYPDLAVHAERTLRSLSINETEVGHHDGRCFLARMLPYRTEQDRIAGVVLTFVDITERNRAETDLRESEERFRVTTDSIPQIVWRMDAAGRFEFFNRQWEVYTGATREPATLAELASQFVHPDDEAATLEAFSAARRESGPFLVEHRLRCTSGEYCWFLVRAEPHRDPDDGRTIHWYGTSTDIGERKRGEVALRTTAERLQLALATARLGTWERNLETGEVIWSPQFTEMYGLPAERERGTYEEWLEHVHPDDREAVAAETLAAIAERRDIMIELRSAPGDGPRWTIAHGRVIYDESGKAVRLIGVAGDITSRKEAEAALRQSEERYRRVVSSVADYAIFTLDPGGSITSWNPGAERIKGYTAEEIIGRNIVLFYTPEQLASGQPARELAAAASRGSCQIEDWRVRKDGSRIWEDDLIVPLHGGDGESLLGYAKICRDLSARKVAEDERARLLAAAQAARREAEAANRAKDQFLAVLSHELRAPLAPVQMALFALKLEKRLSARGRESLEMIERNVESETRLIDDLLDVSRIVHGKFDLMLAPMDLHACILRAVEVCEGDLRAKRLRLNQSLDAIHSHFQGDAARLQQVFWNLLKNAAKFTPEGGTITLLSIDVTGPNGAPGICVEVTDTGIGIPPEALPKLFDAFEQGGPDVVRIYGGLGLGLAISNAIVQAHGGQMRAESRGRDQGATFAVRLPNTSCAGAEERAY
jgi:two-component system CheB/CheR fusion protein